MEQKKSLKPFLSGFLFASLLWSLGWNIYTVRHNISIEPLSWEQSEKDAALVKSLKGGK